MGDDNLPILETNKQHFQEDTAIREEGESLRRGSLQSLRLGKDSAGYQTVKARYLRLRSIFCHCNPTYEVVHIVNGLSTTVSGINSKRVVKPGCAPSEIVNYVKLATGNGLRAGYSDGRLLAVRRDYNGVVTKNSDDGRAVGV